MVLDDTVFPTGPLAPDWNPFTEGATVEKAVFNGGCQHSSHASSTTMEGKRSREYLSTSLTVLVIIQLVGISFITSFSNGILAVGLPRIALDVNLPQSLLLWPSSVGYLASGTLLLLGGALSDVAGPKLVNLIGCVTLTASTVAIGLSRNGLQLIIFRAWQGVAFALAYPSSTAIISLHVPSGPSRNVGFACIGFSMVIGFMSGYFVGAVAWRPGHYAGGAVGFCLLVLGTWALPSDSKTLLEQPTISSLLRKVDWIGACIAGTFLALIITVLR
jgi:MFS family permease